MKEKLTALMKEAGKNGVDWSKFPHTKEFSNIAEFRAEVDHLIISGAADYMVDRGVRIVETGCWVNVNETESFNSGYPVTTTNQTCSVCRATTSFKGKKKDLRDTFCPNCGSMLKDPSKKGVRRG
jgi:tRNA(Ile2) C34 agmatinyltransferase TiaS